MIDIELGIMRHNPNNFQKSKELIDWAMNHGVNHFESCWFYCNFKCEEFLYSLLKDYNRSDYYICGKMPIHGIVARENFKEVFSTQLERVPGNYFDTYLLQALDERAMIDLFENNIISFFLEEKKKKTIHRFGLSIQCKPETFKKLLDLKCWDVVQMPLNYYDWFLCRYDENYKLACDYGIPIIAQAPVKGGLLTKDFKQDSFKNYNRTLIEGAYDFLSSLDNIEMILCGNSSLETFKQSFNSLSTYASSIPLEYYENIINNYKQRIKISCLECGRCSQACPKGLPVSAYISLYNLALNNKIYFNALDILKQAPDEPNHLCNNCRECVQVCPLNNDIPQLFYSNIFELRT